MPSPGRQETACSGQDYYRPDRSGTVTVVAVLDCRDPQRCLAAGRGSLAEREVTLITQEPPSAASGPLLLADISGYTSFLQSVAVAHKDDAFADGAVPDAYEMMSDLMDGIVQRLVPPFTL